MSSYNFLDKSTLDQRIHDSEEYMRPFFEPLAEISRVTRGRPGRIPKGKPRVTDGTLAGSRRETPKRIIQQLPTGKVVIKDKPDLAEQVSGVLTDDILLHANSGGTPYEKSIDAIKDVFDTGISAAMCFYNRRGEWYGADYKRVYIKDVGFEKGKVSEFDRCVEFVTGWYTESDIKWIIHWQEKLKKKADERKEEFSAKFDPKLLQSLLDAGASSKDAENKSPQEDLQDESHDGFFKIVKCMQIGIDAEFYYYAPRIKGVVGTEKNLDPRGIIPTHFMVPERDASNPLGEALAAISVGKQNLLDFDMQMYQYNRGMQMSPPVKKYGNVPNSQIKLVPDAVIDMGGRKQDGNDIEVLEINNSAIADYRNNSSFIKTQIYNEQGASSDSSISGSVGSVGYSKTDSGVKQQESKLGISDNALRKSYEEFQGRIYETLLNIHFAHTKGKKDLDLKPETQKRLNIKDNTTMDYDQDFGKIKFTVDPSTSEAQDSQRENEQLIQLMELRSKYGAKADSKTMLMYNQIVKNAGVDDPEKLMYTDEDIEFSTQQEQVAKQQVMNALLNPPAPEPQIPPQMPVDPALAMPPEQQMPMSQNMPLPEPMPPQPQTGELTEDEAQTIELLSSRGYSDEQTAMAIDMLRNDVDDSQLIQILGQPEGAA